jgi:hypothetical protein
MEKRGANEMIALYIYLGLWTLVVLVFTAVLPLLYLAIYQPFEWALLYVLGLILLYNYLKLNKSGLKIRKNRSC